MAEVDKKRAAILAAWAGTKDKKASKGGDWFRAGRYWAMLEQVTFGADSQQRAGTFFEWLIIKVLDSNPEVTQDAKGDPYVVHPHKVGDQPSLSFWAHQPSAKGNIKRIIGDLTGCDKDAVGEEDIADVCGDNQPLRYSFAEIRAKTILTRGNRKPFTPVNVVRVIPASEVLATLSHEERDFLFRKYKAGFLEGLAAAGV